MDPLLPRRALIEELFSSSAESRVRAAEAVFRATAACNRSLHLLDELHRIRAEARTAREARGDALAAAAESLAAPSRSGVPA